MLKIIVHALADAAKRYRLSIADVLIDCYCCYCQELILFCKIM